MFAKKKIVLNSAQSNNRHGIAEITRFDNFTQLTIKLNNFQPHNDSAYVFLLKNNDLQQKISLTSPCDFSCDVNIPIDLDKKISCLLIESGEKQIPLFWGGTETQSQIMSIISNETSPLTHINNQFHQEIEQPIDMQNVNANAFSSIRSEISINREPNFIKPETQQYDQSINESTSTEQIDKHKNNISKQSDSCSNYDNENNCFDFDQSDIEYVVDNEITKYELVENFEEPNFSQCKNCKYKNVFYQEKYTNEAKQQLAKISQMQQYETIEQNHQYAMQNTKDTCDILQDTDKKIQNDIQILKEYPDVLDDNSKDEIAKNEDNTANEVPYYYGLIKTQYDDMFSKYPIFSPLSNIIENSKWIKIEGVDAPYIMGIIYDNDKPKYLCYGVAQEKKQNPPIEIADSSQWVPFDITNEFGNGVWIMYQSADNGETIKVEVI